ncbi:L-serine ammonia-lyase, partial [Klebsiella pneumoniae]|nr:L-serine ammonia-lyase [Klebsiella pneumoniae]
MMAQECTTRTEAEVRERLLHIRDVMVACATNGMSRDGYLPGNLRVRRRAKDWFVRLNAEDPQRDPAFAEDWVNLVVLAVNE